MSARSVRVALLGVTPTDAADLGAALNRTDPDVAWIVAADDPNRPDAVVDIVLCDSGSSVADAVARWPHAAVVAMVGMHDDGSGVVAALEAGAEICLRREDNLLAAAFIQSVARRRGLLASQGDPE
ncbi:MAG: hypothetical protein QOJ34_1278 [Pseudonocardiales bacterium]|nr:hypothetical protein [Pseudonocardiales bacterium]